MAENVQFFLNLCSCKDEGEADEGRASEQVTIFGKAFPPDYSGAVDVDYRVEDDCVKFRVPERGYDVSLGSASQMEAVLIRVRPERTTIQALYEDLRMTVGAACCHGNGCECYGAIGCSCIVAW